MVDLAGWLAAFSVWATTLAETWGYFGIFVVSLIGNASIIFPLPSYVIVIAFGAILNPWLVGIAAGAGAALGELTGYALGKGGKKVIEKKHKKLLDTSKKWMEKRGLFPVLVLFAATPLPDDIAGILAGIVSYDIKKFLLATFIGKVLAHWALAWAGFYGGELIGGGNMLFWGVIAGIAGLVLYKFVIREMMRKPKKE